MTDSITISDNATAKSIVAALEDGLATSRAILFENSLRYAKARNAEARRPLSDDDLISRVNESVDGLITSYVHRAGNKLWWLLAAREDYSFEMDLYPSNGFIRGRINVSFENGDRLNLESSARFGWSNRGTPFMQYPTRISYLKAGDFESRQVSVEDGGPILDAAAPAEVAAAIKSSREAKAAEEAAKGSKVEAAKAAEAEALADWEAAKDRFDAVEHGDFNSTIKYNKRFLKEALSDEKWEDMSRHEGFFRMNPHAIPRVQEEWESKGGWDAYQEERIAGYKVAIAQAEGAIAAIAERNGLADAKALAAASKEARKERTELGKAHKAAKAARLAAEAEARAERKANGG